ncbi:fumarylacetoacetate hydrolase family protein [Mangrovihabitans endophyticus]|uniref:2-hydroxyhepta-2,4-diene-1,7-dioate isomerase n=1 Tax=Mangrovihabitans endophyticus TaxID=1751298 RepID=A0A8J3BUA8_9ACTN|nr:fumarylacetoacetate hydrolase family protein [Mangrovihabitans endophyticus]GGK75273.1 2-hydroxyhepta-2,4-diene-1,7-dioate isomerase [Mangrovihabitans endophyticus]
MSTDHQRLARVRHPGGCAYARLEVGPDGDTRAVELSGPPFAGGIATGRQWPLSGVSLLAPVVPTKVIGVGRNYAGPADPGAVRPADPLVFLKPPSSVVGPDTPIVLPSASAKVDFEGEVAVVIGRRCRRVDRTRAAQVVFGYTLANDVTARDLQHADGQWTRAKGFDTFCPVGPWVRAGLPPAALCLRTVVDGDVRQEGAPSAMIFDIPALVQWLSAVMTLEPGDLILTGTPAGSAALRPGQTVVVESPHIGRLRNPVRAES